MSEKNKMSASTESIKQVKITLPAMSIADDGGYAQRFIQLRLTELQARKLRSIQLGLEESNAQLIDERYVNSPLDAVRWMLENMK